MKTHRMPNELRIRPGISWNSSIEGNTDQDEAAYPGVRISIGDEALLGIEKTSCIFCTIDPRRSDN